MAKHCLLAKEKGVCELQRHETTQITLEMKAVGRVPVGLCPLLHVMLTHRDEHVVWI